MRIVVYARVSTEEQARTGFSLTEQLRACRERAVALGPGALVSEYQDDSSGEILERPGLQAALALLRQEPVAYFVCLDPDRLARRLMHQLLVTDEIEQTGCRLEFVQHDYQETAEGRLFYQLRGAIAEFEKAKILERTSRGQRGKIAAGGLPHVIRMYGYRFVKGAGKAALARDVLVPDPREAEIVRVIYRWYGQDGLAPLAIAERLNAMGVPTKTARGPWYSTQVLRILRHEAYATGRLTLRKRDHRGIGVARRLPAEQRRRKGLTLTPKARPAEQWQFVEIEPIIDTDLWEGARRRLGAGTGRRSGPSHGDGGPKLLTGLGRCGLCGSPLYYVNGRTIACAGRYGGHWLKDRAATGCRLPGKRRQAVEAAVWDLLAERLLDPATLAAVQSQAPPPPETAWLEAELHARTAELERLGTLFARGLWPEEKALPAMAAAREQIGALRARLDGLRSASTPQAVPDLQAALQRLTAEQQAELIRIAIDHYVLMPSGRGAPPAVTVSFRED